MGVKLDLTSVDAIRALYEPEADIPAVRIYRLEDDGAGIPEVSDKIKAEYAACNNTTSPGKSPGQINRTNTHRRGVRKMSEDKKLREEDQAKVLGYLIEHPDKSYNDALLALAENAEEAAADAAAEKAEKEAADAIDKKVKAYQAEFPHVSYVETMQLLGLKMPGEKEGEPVNVELAAQVRTFAKANKITDGEALKTMYSEGLIKKG